MRALTLHRAVVLGMLGVAGCGPAISVQTVVSPEANLAALHSFRMLPPPRARPGAERLPPDDPMLVNSITNVTLRRAVTQGFESRGYVLNDSAADFLVAVYASAKHKLDVSWWDYGYTWRPRWWRNWGPRPAGRIVTEYVEGTVIIDVLRAGDRELLWRGQGVAVVSNDVNAYLADLQRTVSAILEEFPAAQPPVVAASCGCGSAP